MVEHSKAPRRLSSTTKTVTVPNGDDTYKHDEQLPKEAKTKTTTTVSKTSLKKMGTVLITLLVCVSSMLASFPMLKQANKSVRVLKIESEMAPLSLQRGDEGEDRHVIVESRQRHDSSSNYTVNHRHKKTLRLQPSSTTLSSNSTATEPKVSPSKTTNVLASVSSNNNKKDTAANNKVEHNDDDHSMRACIMVRNDNHLLNEWIAYHYTVLPLRHLVIYSDENATDDPHDVLKLWKGTDLNYEVWYAHNYTQHLSYRHTDPVYRFVRRQTYFMGGCMQHFHKQRNLGWLALVDTDEYIKLNPLDDYLNEKLYVQNKTPSEVVRRFDKEMGRFMSANETLWDRITMRKQLRQRLGLEKNESETTADQVPVQTKIPTVLDVLEEYSAQHNALPCHTMSRLRYSAVMDNLTELSETLCTPRLDPEVTSSMNATGRLSTIRFLYHAAPSDYKHNEWAKVLVDLRRVPYEHLDKIENPHQPMKGVCKGPFIHDMASFIHANHYINDLQVFAGRRGDTRQRNSAGWDKVAHLRDGVRCDHMHGWLNEFVSRFGAERAQQMLGHHHLL